MNKKELIAHINKDINSIRSTPWTISEHYAGELQYAREILKVVQQLPDDPAPGSIIVYGRDGQPVKVGDIPDCTPDGECNQKCSYLHTDKDGVESCALNIAEIKNLGIAYPGPNCPAGVK